MNKMMKKILYFALLVTVFTIGLKQVDAEVVSSVQFEQQPLFNNINFVPGDIATRWIRLSNLTSSPHRVILRAINITDVGNLKEAVSLKIKQGDIVLYDNTFTDLFNHSEIILSQVPENSSVQFDLIATFYPSSGNEYQDSILGFNLQIGFEDTGEMADDTTSINRSGSIATGQRNLIISNEQATGAFPPQSSVILITWNTNLPSTSQVIYGLASDGPYQLDLSLPHFGYPQETIEDITKVTSHAVTLSSLIPERLYFYRVVSRASPPTISYEHTFMLREDGTIIINPVFALATPNDQNDFLPRETINNQDDNGVTFEEISSTTATTTEENGLPLSAAIGSIRGFSFSWWWVVVVIVLGGVLYYIYKKEA